MTWLLWREYRLNRQIAATCAVLLLLSCAFDFGIDLDRDDLIAPDGFFVLLVSALTLALVGGNSIAAERADRSAEFVAYLPLGRGQRLASKLFLPLTGVVVIGAVDLLMLMRQVGIQPIQKQPESLHIFGLVASVALLICGVSWLVSSIQSSAALAATPWILIKGGLKMLQAYTEPMHR